MENTKEVIYYTLNEYIDNYGKTYKTFTGKYKDATELDFIQREVLDYKVYTENTTIYEIDYEPFTLIKTVMFGKNMVSEILDKITKDETKDIDIEKCNNFNYSFKAIITYLETKRIKMQPKNKYFYGCSIEVYKKTYLDRMKQYFERWQDALEIEFIESELNQENPHPRLSTNEYSIKRQKEFLINKAKELGYTIEISDIYGVKIKKILLENNRKKIQENVIDDEPVKSKSFELFDKVRNEDINDYDKTLLLRNHTNNYDIELLKSLAKDIDFYLFVEKDYQEAEYSGQHIQDAIDERIENKLEIPYLKRRPLDTLTERQKELRKKLDDKNGKYQPSIDLEQLLFPYEFFTVYQFKAKIYNKIKELQGESTENNNTIDWKGTPTELTALIKALIESNKLDNSLSEIQIVKKFELFFNTEIKAYDQTKTRIRNRTKDYTPFIDKLKTNLEQWILKKD